MAATGCPSTRVEAAPRRASRRHRAAPRRASRHHQRRASNEDEDTLLYEYDYDASGNASTQFHEFTVRAFWLECDGLVNT